MINEDLTQDEIVEENLEEIIEETVEEEEFTEIEKTIEVELDKMKDKYTRLLADYDNLKRRSALEGIDAKSKGKVEVFEQILEVLDNLERAMQYDAGTKEFKDGITLVHKQLIERLENVGLEEIETDGQLDANFHQAVVVETVDGYEDDQIIDVMQKGYITNDKLIRPAMVKVNKK